MSLDMACSECHVFWCHIVRLNLSSVMKTVLKNCKQTLYYLGVGSLPWKLAYNRELPNAIVKLICVSCYLMGYIPMVLFVFVKSDGHSCIDSTLYLSINSTLVLLMFIDFLRNGVLIQQAIDHLTRTVLKSE